VLAPLRTILENGGIESSVILDKVIQGQGNFGYDAKSNEYVDMVKSGIIDPKKVTRVALENAASVAGMILTIGCVFVDSDIINQENQVVN
jgi:chaperonin GroEL